MSITKSVAGPQDAAAKIQPAVLQRSSGEVRLAFKLRATSTVLDDLYQSGSGKIKMARSEAGRPKEAVIINTTGGLTDGDRFSSSIHWQEGTAAVVTTQAAERIYKSRGDNAAVTTDLTIDGAALGMWLPQETILFDGARLARENRVDLANNARLIAVESCIFGRAAMGEQVNSGFLRDGWHIRIDGKLVFADRFQLEGNIQANLDRKAIANGANALATIIHVGCNGIEICQKIRKIIENCPVTGGCSSIAPQGALTITRLFAKNAQDLRKSIGDILEMLISREYPAIYGSPLPRVWSL